MPFLLRQFFPSMRYVLAILVPFCLLAVGLSWLVYVLLDPAPPKKVVLATGVEQGAYSAFGRQFAALLKDEGLQVELRYTQGTAENLALLRDPANTVDFAFVQSGSDPLLRPNDDASMADLVSLGSLFYEPVWLFYREAAARQRLRSPALRTLTDLAASGGWKINVGAAGSGIATLSTKLFEANGIDMAKLQLLRQPQAQSVDTLLAGRSDALVLVSAPESALVQALLKAPGIKLFSFEQAQAYSRRFPFMSAVTLPHGVVDLGRDLPRADVQLIAPTATLVTRPSTHPALIQLFLQTAQRVHGGDGWFQRKGDFPNARNNERPLAPEAQRHFQSGPPLLQRYLPFWLANLIDRLWPVLVSILAILIPVTRMLPPLYDFGIRQRIFRWYGQLRALETLCDKEASASHRRDWVRELDDIENRVAHISVPLSYADELYALRTHIALVRLKLSAGDMPLPPADRAALPR